MKKYVIINNHNPIPTDSPTQIGLFVGKTKGAVAKQFIRGIKDIQHAERLGYCLLKDYQRWMGITISPPKEKKIKIHYEGIVPLEYCIECDELVNHCICKLADFQIKTLGSTETHVDCPFCGELVKRGLLNFADHFQNCQTKIK